MGAPIAAPSNSTQAADVSPTPGEAVQPAANTLPPIVPTSAKSAVDPLLSQAPPAHPSAVGQPEAQTSLSATNPEEQASAAPRFAHDSNYRWLVGSLEYSRIQQAWLLRYVPFDEEDRYGGCVTLVMSSRTLNFKPGQMVRVEGGLIDPESRQLRPAFEVQNIRAP